LLPRDLARPGLSALALGLLVLVLALEPVFVVALALVFGLVLVLVELVFGLDPGLELTPLLAAILRFFPLERGLVLAGR
jgi:hypothetical protein